MVWENCPFWTGNHEDCDDINPRRFDWWCPDCGLAIKDEHTDDGLCPKCGSELNDIEDEIDVSEEFSSGVVNGMTQDDEGNWGYD